MIVIDSDVLIDLLRKSSVETEFLARLHRSGETLATTSINVAEVLRGAQGSPAILEQALRQLDLLVVVPIGPRAARRFGQLMHGLDRAGSPISAMDGLVAAAALEEGATIVTHNADEFRRVGGLKVVVPRPADR